MGKNGEIILDISKIFTDKDFRVFSEKGFAQNYVNWMLKYFNVNEMTYDDFITGEYKLREDLMPKETVPETETPATTSNTSNTNN